MHFAAVLISPLISANVKNQQRNHSVRRWVLKLLIRGDFKFLRNVFYDNVNFPDSLGIITPTATASLTF